jgi:hypothetical protein
MQIATFPWIPCAVGLVGASLIVVTPATHVTPDFEVPAVALTASGNPITDLIDVLQAAVPTATALSDEIAGDPFPVLQQIIENQIGYVENFPADAGTIPTEIADNLQAAIAAALGPDGSEYVYSQLPSILPGIADYQALYQFGESAASGVVLGEVGTVLSPILAFDDSFQTIIDDLTGATPDATAAFNELLEIPATVTNAFLNGYGDIDLAPLISDLGPVAAHYTLNGSLDLGGLLSPAGTFQSALDLAFQYGPVCTISPDGTGECVESVGEQLGQPVGPIASLEALAQDVAHAISPTGTTDGLPDVSTLFGGDLTTLLGGDLSTALTNLPTEFGTLSTDILSGLTSLF